MTIGKAYESAKIEVQACSANRPPTKESLKAVSKNKPKKVLMCNYFASKIGAHGFSGKKLNPTRGAVYRKWHRPCSSHCSREKKPGGFMSESSAKSENFSCGLGQSSQCGDS